MPLPRICREKRLAGVIPAGGAQKAVQMCGVRTFPAIILMSALMSGATLSLLAETQGPRDTVIAPPSATQAKPAAPSALDTPQAATPVTTATWETLMEKGDHEESQGKSAAALQLFLQSDKLKPDNGDVLVRIAKQYGDLVGQSKNPAEAKSRAQLSLDFAKRGAALLPESGKAHLCLAIAYGRMADYTGNKERVELSRKILEHVQISLKKDPSNDYAWHVMGRWHAGVASTNGFLKGLAKIAYGGLPPASQTEAARCLKKASELAPQRIMHHAELAKVYVELDQISAARQSWQAVMGIRPVDSEDRKYQAEAQTELRKTAPRGSSKRLVTGK